MNRSGDSGKKNADAEPPRTRVFIVDDHPIVRQGLGLLITREKDMEVAGEADNAADALRVIDQVKPDVAVVDLALKESSGLELLKDLRIRAPKVLVLVFSMREESLYADRVLRAGGRGYVTKDEGGRVVIEGIRKIVQGQIFLSDHMASKMLGRLAQGDSAGTTPMEKLSDRELAVYEMIGQGLPTREIAEKLHLSVKTIDSHREHIKLKLGIDNATDLLKHAIEWVSQRRGA